MLTIILFSGAAILSAGAYLHRIGNEIAQIAQDGLNDAGKALAIEMGL